MDGSIPQKSSISNQILTDYGIPYQFFTDNRTVFEYTLSRQTSVEKDTFAQFGYACKQLGIEICTSSVAQAKGRVKRMFGTLQSRLPVELRLANVTSIQQANEFLRSYVKRFNQQFALPLDGIKSVFEIQPNIEKINLILAVLSSRKIDNGSCLKYQSECYLPINGKGYPVHYRKGTTAMVIKAFDGEHRRYLYRVRGCRRLFQPTRHSRAPTAEEANNELTKEFQPTRPSRTPTFLC